MSRSCRSFCASSPTTKDAKLLVNSAAPGPVQLLKAGQVPFLVYAPATMIHLTAIDDLNRLLRGQQPLDVLTPQQLEQLHGIGRSILEALDAAG